MKYYWDLLSIWWHSGFISVFKTTVISVHENYFSFTFCVNTIQELLRTVFLKHIFSKKKSHNLKWITALNANIQNVHEKTSIFRFDGFTPIVLKTSRRIHCWIVSNILQYWKTCFISDEVTYSQPQASLFS